MINLENIMLSEKPVTKVEYSMKCPESANPQGPKAD